MHQSYRANRGKKTFKEFTESVEAIASNILSPQL